MPKTQRLQPQQEALQAMLTLIGQQRSALAGLDAQVVAELAARGNLLAERVRALEDGDTAPDMAADLLPLVLAAKEANAHLAPLLSRLVEVTATELRMVTVLPRAASYDSRGRAPWRSATTAVIPGSEAHTP